MSANRSAALVRCVSLAFSLGAAALAAPVQAQIGSGWTRLALNDDYIDTQSMGRHARHPVGVNLTTSGARYTKEGDAETFELFDPSFNRVEHDTNHHYRTGKVQFEGIVQIYPGVNHQFIVQNFNAARSGPIMALSAYSRDNGVIIKQGGSVEVARNAFGRDIRVNIIHDLDADTLAVYIDGVRAWAGAGGLGGGGFNFKYGSYGSLNGSTSAKARWKNVQLFTGGGAPPPGPDAGARDMSPPGDTAGSPDVAADASAGGSGTDAAADGGGRGGAGGAGGSGGTGGAGGAGGSAGAGGTGGGGQGAGRGGTGAAGRGGSGAGPVDQPGTSAGCGCRLGAGLQGTGALLPLAVVIALGAASRARRRRARLKK